MLDVHLDEEDQTQDPYKIEFTFIFSLIWSLGASLNPQSRQRFENAMMKISARVFLTISLFEHYYDQYNKNFRNWEKLWTE